MLSVRTVKWLTRTGIVLPVLLAFYFVYKYGIHVPYWDEWEFVTLLEKFHNHTLTIGDFWAQHSEHRIFFPRLLMLLFAHISGWNIYYELFFSIIFATISLCFLFSLLDNTQASKNNSIIKVIISLLIFSMAQYENWSFGWAIQIFMSMTGVIAAIWSVDKWQGQMRGLIIAIFAAIFANYSFGSGILIWPSVLFMLVFQKKWKLKHIIIWLVTGCATVGSYYYKHTSSSFDTPMMYFLSHPIMFAEYVFGYLGSPLARSIFSSVFIALVLVIIIILSFLDIRKLDKEQSLRMIPWLAFIVFAVLSACLTGFGRVGFGVRQAMTSRYITISTLFVISAAVLLYNSTILNLKMNRMPVFKDKLFIVITASIFIITYSISYRHGVKGMIEKQQQINPALNCFENPDSASEENLEILYPNPDVVRQRIKILSEMGIGFAQEK
ncbi:MAG: hypothetical protein JXA96_03800 [Sedimentisphaerales bacterium]|nr:hypothetical protein [Sedimentisphaerales bacterium]